MNIKLFIKRGTEIMLTCKYCKRHIVLKVILAVLNLKPAEIARDVHVSKSFVSKYLIGERISTEIDLYLIEKIFFIKVKDFSRNE